ncbi:MAG: M48 family metallopeptidase [Cognaticolwellia sp.]
MKYQLIRSARRKTVALQVRHGEVIVRAPSYVETAYIEKFMQLKKSWLQEKIAEQKETQQQNPSAGIGLNLQFSDQKLINSPTIFIDGLPHKLMIEFGQKCIMHNSIEQTLTLVLSTRYTNYDLNCDAILSKIKSHIEAWFKIRVDDYVKQKLPLFSVQMSLYPSAYKVRKYKTRWGSCNNRGELSFNSLLAMVPLWVVDYVIVHELCHLKHMNHSINFWQLVKQYYPDFQSAKHWLKQHQSVLNWQ